MQMSGENGGFWVKETSTKALRPGASLACQWPNSESSGPDVSQGEIVGVKLWEGHDLLRSFWT